MNGLKFRRHEINQASLSRRSLQDVISVRTNSVELAAQTNPARYLYAAQALRDFGDGFIAVLLPVYLVAMGLGAWEVGVVATFALFGSAVMTLGTGLLGARIGQRALLLAASGLMIATGIAFAWSSTYPVVLLVAFAGTINPSAGTVSIFVPLEHAVLSRSVPDTSRTRMFARYSLIGALAAAVGSLAAASPDFLQALGMSQLGALKGMFLAYALLGLAGGVLYARIPVDQAKPGREAKRCARPVARHRLQNGRPVQCGCLCWRICSSIAACALAFR